MHSSNMSMVLSMGLALSLGAVAGRSPESQKRYDDYINKMRLKKFFECVAVACHLQEQEDIIATWPRQARKRLDGMNPTSRSKAYLSMRNFYYSGT